ncbi:hypothetical protein DVJ78_01005 [Humibacter sp. BT305]|nr:hypothetical protein DVJ78_01005 [Humibacter sp. BT305]
MLGVELRSTRLATGDGTSVEVEGADPERTVVVQFVLNGGAVRSALRNKVAADLFKLVWVCRCVAVGARPVLCVSATVASFLEGRGWLPSAAADLGVAVFVVADGGDLRELRAGSPAPAGAADVTRP